jgi:hypothetical protein
MKDNYIIVLFKNKKKRKIIKSYKTEKKAKEKFEELLKISNDIIFNKKIENATECEYQLGLLTKKTKIEDSIFYTDGLGRNIVVKVEDPDYVFLDIKLYNIEELIFDWQTQNKITFNDFIKNYCNKSDLKSIYTLHNKICVQIDENVSIFSFKDSDESDRFLFTLEDYFIDNSRSDAFFVRDISTAQRKWIYNILENKGFNKKRLYRLKTTFSKR